VGRVGFAGVSRPLDPELQVVTVMMDPELRRYLNELYAQADRWQAEHEVWLARRQVECAMLTREIDEMGLLHIPKSHQSPPQSLLRPILARSRTTACRCGSSAMDAIKR